MAKYNRKNNEDENVTHRKTQKIRYAADDDYDAYDEYEEYEDEYDDDQARKHAGRGCLIAFLVVVALIVGVILYGVFFVKGEIDGKNATATESVVFDVAPGSGGSIVGGQLVEQGLIKYDNIFRFYVRFNGAGSNFQTGRFTLEPGMSYDEIIETLSEPPPPRDVVSVTFPEGSTVMQFAAIAEKNGLCSAEEFIETANNVELFSDIEFFQYLEFDPDTWMKAEGYLAPNTYEFYVDETPENIVRRLYEQFNAEMTAERYQLMEERGLSLRDLVGLASVVEEEAGDPANQPAVARVFWNRLTADLEQTDLVRRTLGSDATFFYIRDWIARDYGGDYQNVPENLFYGYYSADDDDKVRDGFLAGPISCPSTTAIDAVLTPSDDPEIMESFYFLTDYYGTYYYARTFGQHSANIETMNRMNAQYEAEGGDMENVETPAGDVSTPGEGEGEAPSEDAAA